MKANANREGLLTAFQVVSSVVPARSPKPILRQVKLVLSEDGTAILMATDLDLGVRYKVSGLNVEKPGQAILPTSEMISILRELSDETVQLELSDGGIRVIAASSRFELSSEDPLEFPEVPDFDAGPAWKIKSSVFATMIRRTIFSVAQENSRYALNSVLIEFPEEGKAQLVSSDGKRLAMMPGPTTQSGPAPTGLTLIPPKALALVQKTLVDPDEEVELAVRENEILFRTGKVTIYSRLTDGRYPRYQDVFPPSPKVKAPLIVSRFLGAVRQAKIVTSEESKGVDFKFEDGTLTLRSRGAEVGQSEVRLPIGYDGDPLEITFDPQLLIDALRVLDADQEISLEMIDDRKAAVMRTIDQYAYLIMPLTRERDRG